MESFLIQLETYFLNFMFNSQNKDTHTFKKLWEIEFFENPNISIEEDDIIISGDNGRITLKELHQEV